MPHYADAPHTQQSLLLFHGVWMCTLSHGVYPSPECVPYPRVCTLSHVMYPIPECVPYHMVCTLAQSYLALNLLL